MATNLDDLLAAIEGLRGDRKAAFTVLMSAACTCMDVVLDEAEPELRERLEASDDAGFRVMLWGARRLDLLLDDWFMRLAEVAGGMVRRATEGRP